MSKRHVQMSDQEALIAKKKAEFEEKRKEMENQGSISLYKKLSSTVTPKPSPANIKNRWGFKGKKVLKSGVIPLPGEEECEPSTSSKNPSNTFSNDGSFFEQFKKMAEEKQKKEEQSARPQITVNFVQSKVPPPPPKRPLPRSGPHVPSTLVKPEPSSSSKEPDWYKSAVERAKEIAQSFAKGNAVPPPPPPPAVKTEVKSEPVTDEYGGPSEYGFPAALRGAPPPPPPPPRTPPPQPETYSPSKPSEPTPTKVKEEVSLTADMLPTVADELASMVAVSGDGLEEIARARNVGEKELSFLFDPESDLYRKYRAKVESLRNGIKAEQNAVSEDSVPGEPNADDPPKKKKRSSRWGSEEDKVAVPAPVGLVNPSLGSVSMGALKRSDPNLIQYAIRVFGTVDLEEGQWKQCEDQMKMTLVYQDLLVKKERQEQLNRQGKVKYEYDSDEETEGGTWEHKKRAQEMLKTLEESAKLTAAGEGKHHIGDFLPAEELTKFMAKYEAIKTGTEFTEEDTDTNKLTDSNLGFKMLQKMGWSEGTGLGSEGQGIVKPIEASGHGEDKKGLGINKPHQLEEADDEFDAYRKRMMLAYRFRPNPLNNPRRAYY